MPKQKKKNKNDNSIMTVAIITAFFMIASLADKSWGTEASRAIVAVLGMFLSTFIGYFIRDGIPEDN